MNFSGIIPVMLTPFNEDGGIDWDSYSKLIDWYLRHDVDGLFAVCQSSEMFFLDQQERTDLSAFTVREVAGRVPVLASGHVSDQLDAQLIELAAIADTGVDAVVLVTNRIQNRDCITQILQSLPADIALGLYECPYPERKLLSEEDIRFYVDTGRFQVLKDVCCDFNTLSRRLEITANSQLTIQNANAAIAWPAMKAGAPGFCGVLNNVHPDLYAWLLRQSDAPTALAEELSSFLAMAALIETQGYPAVAKRYHQRLGTLSSVHCRCISENLHEKYWGLEAILDRIHAGTEIYRQKIRAQNN